MYIKVYLSTFLLMNIFVFIKLNHMKILLLSVKTSQISAISWRSILHIKLRELFLHVPVCVHGGRCHWRVSTGEQNCLVMGQAHFKLADVAKLPATVSTNLCSVSVYNVTLYSLIHIFLEFRYNKNSYPGLKMQPT